MRSLDGILKMVDSEMESMAKNGKFHTRDEIDVVYKLIDIAKDVYCIWEYEDEDEEMSFADGPYTRGGRGKVYYGTSYAKGRRNAKRDSMGRYSRAEGKEEFAEHLRELMEDAPDEETRHSIKRMLSQMETM